MNTSEIFESIQGEGSSAGLPMTFVRFAGCNLRCSYCDSLYALEGGIEMSVNEVFKHCLAKPWRRVELTGGEPMLQDGIVSLCGLLLSSGFKVLIETNGSADLSSLPASVVKIVDIKTPGSGSGDSFLESNLDLLGSDDELKLVLTSREDYDWAKNFISDKNLMGKCEILFSPASPVLSPENLAEWILRDGLDVRFNPNVHRYIWKDNSRGR